MPQGNELHYECFRYSSCLIRFALAKTVIVNEEELLTNSLKL